MQEFRKCPLGDECKSRAREEPVRGRWLLTMHGTIILPGRTVGRNGRADPVCPAAFGGGGATATNIYSSRMNHASTITRPGSAVGTDSVVWLALVMDAWEQPRWVADALREALSSGTMSVCVVGLVGENPGTPSGVEPLRQGAASSLLARLYSAADRMRFRPDEAPFAPESLRPLVGGVRTSQLAAGVMAEGGETSLVFGEGQQPDLVLNLSSRLETGRLARAAPMGACAFVLGDRSHALGDDVGVGEVLHGEPVIRVRLERWDRAEGPATPVIETITNTHPFSAGRTRAIAARHASTLLARLGRTLVVERRDRLPPLAPAAGPAPATPRSSRTAGAGGGLLRLAARYVRYLTVGWRTRDQWVLAYHRGDADDASSVPPERRLAQYRKIIPPSDRFWADPFPLRLGGRDFLLFEELIFADDVGHLSVLELGPDGPLGEPTTVLKRPFHLSYPFTFEFDGQLYLLPEMALEGRLELYRAVRAPYEWVLDRVIMEGPMLMDATLEEIDGRWWMFASEYREGLQPWTDLLVFHADSPLGPWTPHPRNPVVSDVRSARPAGRLFREDGAWIRPAQDCSRSYGGAITLRRITTLTPTDYDEVAASYIAADGSSGWKGPHTLNVHRGLSAIDLKRSVRQTGAGLGKR